MHSLLNYASSDDEDEDGKAAVPAPAKPPPSITAADTTTTALPSLALSPPPATSTPSVPLSLPPPTKAAITQQSRAAVLSSLASSLSALHSSNSPFATSILDSSLEKDSEAPTTAAPTPALSTFPATAPNSSTRQQSSTAATKAGSASAVNGTKKVSLPSAASLLSALPSDSAGWERRTAGSLAHPPLDRSQYHAVPLPASLRPPVGESDAFRFTPHIHNAAASASTHKQQSLAPDSTHAFPVPAPSTAEASTAAASADAATTAPSASKSLPFRPSGQACSAGATGLSTARVQSLTTLLCVCRVAARCATRAASGVS